MYTVPCKHLSFHNCASAWLPWVAASKPSASIVAKGNKHDHELNLLQRLLDQFKAGDLALADRGFSTYTLLGLLLRRGVHCLFRLHQARPTDLRKGKRPGKNDRLMRWSKPCQKPRYLPKTLWNLVIRGCLLSVNEGNAAKRVAIGFGSGKSELRTMVEGFQMTAQGLRKLGVGTVDAAGGKSPGAALGLATFLATKNPAGFTISGGMHVYGEASGSSTVEGRAKATAKEISDQLKKRFQEQGWVNK